MSSDAAAFDAGDQADSVERWLDEVTERLRVDPEIRLEVRQELRSHFDEAVNELLRAGRNDDEAREEALQSLGDAKVLGKQLFRANRGRMKWRAILLWSARLVLPLVAGALIFVLSISAIRATSFVKPLMTGMSSQPSFLSEISTSYRQQTVAAAPADVKLLFAQERASDKRTLAKEYLDLHPDDLAAYFNYAQAVMMYAGSQEKGPNAATSVGKALAVLATGEKRDPCNAYYPLMQSALLLERGVSVQWPSEVPKGELWASPTITVKNEKDLQVGLAAFRRAAAMPVFHAYWHELLLRKLAVVPDATLGDVCFRLQEEISTLMPYDIDARGACEVVCAYAVVHNEPKLSQDLHQMSAKLAKDSKCINGLFVALSVEGFGNETDYLIAKANHNSDATRAVRARVDHWDVEWKELHSAQEASLRRQQVKKAGFIFSAMLPTGVYYKDVGEIRGMAHAEYDAADTAMLAIIALVLVGQALLYGVSGLMEQRRTGEQPQLALVLPAGAIGKIVLLAVVLPVVVFWIYARWTPLGGRAYGFNAIWLRVLAQYAILLGAIVILVEVVTTRAIRRRAEELGIAIAAPKIRLRWLLAGAVMFALASVAGAVLLTSYVRTSYPQVGLIIIGGFVPYVVVRLVEDAQRRRGGDPYGGMLARSMFVPMVVAAVAVALLGLPLKLAEAHNVRQVVRGDHTILVGHEVERTPYAQWRRKLAS